MTNNPASLQNLHDIIVSTPVPFWPPAPGWILLLGLFIMLASFLLFRAVIRYHRNAYRRAALAELRLAADGPEPLPLIASLLKRTALVAYRREQVASLTGETWISWLAMTGGKAVPSQVETALTDGVYGGAAADPKALTDFAISWIRNHRGGQ